MKPGKNSLSLKQLAGLPKNTLARPVCDTGLAETKMMAKIYL